MAADWWKTEGFTTESQYFHSCNTTESAVPQWLQACEWRERCVISRIITVSYHSAEFVWLSASIIVLGCLDWPHTMQYKQSGPIDEQLLAHFTTRLPCPQCLHLCQLPVISLTHLAGVACECILARRGNGTDLHHPGEEMQSSQDWLEPRCILYVTQFWKIDQKSRD